MNTASLQGQSPLQPVLGHGRDLTPDLLVTRGVEVAQIGDGLRCTFGCNHPLAHVR